MRAAVLAKFSANPELLKRQYPEMVKRLHAMTDKNGQGSGNMPTHQESCFATEAENCGFKFIGKNENPSENGSYIKYQPNGTQQSIDFQIFEVDGGHVKKVDIDLKHAKGMSFYLNDGWFEDDVIYIVSYTSKKKDCVYIGLGKDTPSDEERELMSEIVSMKKRWNSNNKKVGSLRPYLRFANQYSCATFTPEFTKEKWESVEQFLK